MSSLIARYCRYLYAVNTLTSLISKMFSKRNCSFSEFHFVCSRLKCVNSPLCKVVFVPKRLFQIYKLFWLNVDMLYMKMESRGIFYHDKFGQIDFLINQLIKAVKTTNLESKCLCFVRSEEKRLYIYIYIYI